MFMGLCHRVVIFTGTSLSAPPPDTTTTYGLVPSPSTASTLRSAHSGSFEAQAGASPLQPHRRLRFPPGQAPLSQAGTPPGVCSAWNPLSLLPTWHLDLCQLLRLLSEMVRRSTHCLTSHPWVSSRPPPCFPPRHLGDWFILCLPLSVSSGRMESPCGRCYDLSVCDFPKPLC